MFETKFIRLVGHYLVCAVAVVVQINRWIMIIKNLNKLTVRYLKLSVWFYRISTYVCRY